MATVQTLSGFPDVLDVRFRDIFYKVYDKVDTSYQSVVQVKNSDRNYEKYSGVSGVGEFSKLAENEEVVKTTRIQDYDKTFTHDRYSNSVEISKDLLADDQFGVIDQQSSSLAMSAKRKLDERMAEMFNYGFSATDALGDSLLAADGIRIFSTVHYKNPDETGTTYSNASATGITLTEENLETGLIAMREQLNPRGKLVYCKASHIIVPPALEKEAHIILDTTLRPDTSDNDINWLKGKVNIIVWDQLSSATGGSDTAWFLMDKSAHQMMLLMREQPNFPSTSPEYDQGKRIWEYVMDMRFSFGVVGWRGLWGSAGDGAAYSS